MLTTASITVRTVAHNYCKSSRNSRESEKPSGTDVKVDIDKPARLFCLFPRARKLYSLNFSKRNLAQNEKRAVSGINRLKFPLTKTIGVSNNQLLKLMFRVENLFYMALHAFQYSLPML